jgi:hypothetical protein
MRQVHGRLTFVGNSEIVLVFNNVKTGIIISDQQPVTGIG